MASLLELEGEIAATRERLGQTIDKIQDKLTVSGMVDEIMGQAGVPSAEASHDLVLGLLRRHPVPVMVAAAGLGFLIYRMDRRSGSVPAYAALPVEPTARRPYDPDQPVRHPAPIGSDADDFRA